MKKRNNTGALQMSFAWIFAIIAGAFILFLAIFGVVRFMNIEKTAQDAETAKSIGVLLNPLETGFETGKTSLLSNSMDTRIYCGCSESGFFGKQTIKVSQKISGEWSETDTNIPASNKYIFAENPIEGKKFYIFTKPFDFPFKVADLIYIIPSDTNYCFSGNVPEDIEEEIEDLQKGGLLNNIFLEDCPSESVEVCFNSGNNCDIKVYYNANQPYIERYNEKEVYFEGDALMYAGIFADNDTYECQLNRLMKRTAQLSSLYMDKANFVFDKTGCISGIKPELIILNNLAGNLKESQGIVAIKPVADNLQSKNENEECMLW